MKYCKVDKNKIITCRMPMKTFFYSARNAACDNGCHYMKCSKRCLYLLENLETLKEIIVLTGGSHFNTTQSMHLRSGDLVILYAGNGQELEDLVSIRDVFETFRIILIVGQEHYINDRKCHLLNPRYITSVGQNVAGLNAVIGKMTGVA
jgi:hypothetical protein